MHLTRVKEFLTGPLPQGTRPAETRYFLYLLLALLLFGYLIPIALYRSPTGSDVYTHIYNTMIMVDSSSLNEFYEKSFTSESAMSEYPFGMWYFGSLVMKVTGLDAGAFLVSFPVIFLGIVLLVFFSYARLLLGSEEKSALSLVFYLSMPILVLNILNYSTNVFVGIFLIIILFFTFQEFRIQNFLVVSLLVFALVFSHTGTYMFLVFFATTSFLISALIWKKIDMNMFFVVVISLFFYIFALRIFPFVQPQYIDKGRIILTVSGWLGSLLKFPVINDLGVIFYENIFVSNNVIYAMFWSSLIYIGGLLCIQIHTRFQSVYPARFRAVPFIGSITSLSHGIAMTPFWVGPVQSILSLFGFFRLDERGKNILLSLLVSAVIPGALQSSEGTGSLREITFLYLILPICAAEGFFLLSGRLGVFGPTAGDGTSRRRTGRIVPAAFSLIILLPLITVPIIGNLHYQPALFGTRSENENLRWLGNIGSQAEGVSSFVYRERISLYANKTIPSIPSGSETKRFLGDLEKIYFSPESEASADDLYTFNIQYLIASPRILGEYPDRSGFSIDANRRLDKIYSSDTDYGIYSYIRHPVSRVSVSPLRSGLEFVELNRSVRELGSVFLFENDAYKVKLSYRSPRITYLGTKTDDLLQEGEFVDEIMISWPYRNRNRYATYDLNDLTYPTVVMEKNRVSYQTIIRDESATEYWATMTVTYEFLEHAIRREITLSHDWMNDEGTDPMNIDFSTSVYAPVEEFTLDDSTHAGSSPVTKTIYPSLDYSTIRNRVFNEVYLKGPETGLLMRYGDTAPYPTAILYMGEILEDYSTVTVASTYQLSPSDSLHVTQYLSVGEKVAAQKTVDQYTSIAPYPYPRGQIPLVIAGYTRGNLSETIPEGVNLLGDPGVPYHLIDASLTDNSTEEPGATIGYASSYSGEYFKDRATIGGEIRGITRRRPVTGMIFEFFKYNMDTVAALSENNISYLIAFPVPAPSSDSPQLVSRDPRIATYHGVGTDLVLVPVTAPESSFLRYGPDPDAVFAGWNATLTTVTNETGIAVFLWDSAEILDTAYRDRFISLVNSSRSLGMSYPSLDSLVSHFRMMQNVTVLARVELDSATLRILNGNGNRVEGITYRIRLPAIEGRCPYRAGDASIRREDLRGDTCAFLISLDAGPWEEKTVTIEPDITRTGFLDTFPPMYEGTNTLVIRNASGGPVGNATAWIDGRRYESNDLGEVTFTASRGSHSLVLEKPGFSKVSRRLEIPGKISLYLRTFTASLLG